MSVFSKVVKLGIAKKVYDEARKPENQQKVKDLIESAKNRRKRPRTEPPAG